MPGDQMPCRLSKGGLGQPDGYSPLQRPSSITRLPGVGASGPAGNLTALLKKLSAYETLNRQEAEAAMHAIAAGAVPDSQLAAFVSAFLMRTPVPDEIRGFRDALMGLAVRPDLDADTAIDIVGTGGDGKGTFNISTLAAFVVAGAGYKVIKHGNYGSSNRNGASNVLEYLGFQFCTDSAVLNRQLEQANFCFLHAPAFHPALKQVAGFRKGLGLRTLFNLLGPLVNPAAPGFMLLGVSSMLQARLYQYLLQTEGKEYRIVHSLDGYDEISLTGTFRVLGRNYDRLFDPEMLGIPRLPPEALLAGDSPEGTARIFMNVLKGAGTPAQQRVVEVNSAMALQCLNKARIGIEECMQVARESLESGKALRAFQTALEISSR